MDCSDNNGDNNKVPLRIPRRVSLRRRVLEYNLVQLRARQLAMQERDIQIRNNYERLRASRQNLIAACEEDEDAEGDNETSDVEAERNRNPAARRRSKRHAISSDFFRTLTKKLRQADCSSGKSSRGSGEYENKQCESEEANGGIQEFKMAAPDSEMRVLDDRSADASEGNEIPGLVRSQAIMNLASQFQELKGSSTSLDEPSTQKENMTSDSEDVEMEFSSPSSLPIHAHNPPQRSSSMCLTLKSKPRKVTKHRSLRLPSLLRCKPRVYDHVVVDASPPPNKKGKHELPLSSPGYVTSGSGKSYSVPAAPLPRRRALSVQYTPVQWKDLT